MDAEVVVLLAVATAGLLAGRAFGLPAVAAYLVAGVLVGPGALGLVGHSERVGQLAELGVALLLFGVGIEFSLDQLRRRLWQMTASGTLQVAVTTTLGAALFRTLGAGWPAAVFTGFLVTLSSTAIVFKLLADEGELDAPQGQAAAGILLLQDLALVPMMLLVPVLAAPADGMVVGAGGAVVRALVAVGAVLILARAVLPRVLELVARAGTPELFPLGALVAAFGTALAAQALGLSLPIGTFLAGLALSGSRYAHQVFAEVLPLRDAFVALFFTSIGVLLEPAAVIAQPGLVAAMFAAVALKGAVVAAIVAIVWRAPRIGVMAGLALSQIGEFSFVLSRAGVETGLFARAWEQAFLGVAVVTMAVTPFLVRAGRRLATAGSHAPGRDAGVREGHVLVLGHGTTGRAVARVLSETGVPFVAVELAADVVREAHAEGMPIEFGDGSRRAVLETLGAARARAAVVTIGDPAATRRAASLLRQLNPEMRIIVRVQRVAEIEELERLGADDVVPSEFETSIELFVRLLTHLGVPRHVVRLQESLIRLDHYQALRGAPLSTEAMRRAGEIIAGGILETARVMEGSPAVGKTMAQLDLRKRTGATVLSIVRNEAPLPGVVAATDLEAGDLVVLYGPHHAIDAALALLEPPTSG
jgi:CPA2 family monovalent cation:H+ antiporter-2